MGRTVFALLLSLAVLSGCAPRSGGGAVERRPSAPPFLAPGADPWKLVWTDPAASVPALLWNGTIGVRVGPLGNGFDSEGKPLPMFALTRYEPSGEERIHTLATPLATVLIVGGVKLGSSGLHDWKQELDMRTGVLATSWQEDNPTAGRVTVRSELALATEGALLAERWTVHVEAECAVEVLAAFGGPEAVATWKGSHVVYGSPSVRVGVDQMVTGHKATGGSPDPRVTRIANGVRLGAMNAMPDRPLEFQRVMAVDLRDPRATPGPDGGADVAADFLSVVRTSAEAWAARWKTDIEIEGPVEDRQAVRSFLFYLRSAVSPQGKMSISPMGLSSDLYGGHVFWDADMWVMPALAFIQPDGAKAIADYRIRMLEAAAKNYRDWWLAGGPTANPSYKCTAGRVLGGESFGYKFPWESSVTGKETAPGPSRFEDHISGTVAFSLANAAALGFADPAMVSQVISGVANFYRDRSTEGANGPREIKAVMSPDENHIGDNDLYTNLLAQWCVNGGIWENPPARSYQPPIFYLPKDKVSFLTYDNDPVKGYKQAAAVLAIYPLQYPPAEAQARAMMDRFADKASRNGPAMTDSIHATIWARLGEKDKAYEAWRRGWREFVRPPSLLFSEKRGQERTYFATGAAGELNSVLYGFLGFRIDSKPEAGANWTLKLRGDRWLSVKPNLPKAWKRVTFRNFHVLGKTYTLTATHQSVQVTQGD